MNLHPIFAQCVMCFRTAEAQQGERSRVLNSGIVILLIPPLLVLAAILWLAWRSEKARQSKNDAPPLAPADFSVAVLERPDH